MHLTETSALHQKSSNTYEVVLELHAMSVIGFEGPLEHTSMTSKAVLAGSITQVDVVVRRLIVSDAPLDRSYFLSSSVCTHSAAETLWTTYSSPEMIQ